MKKTFVIIMTVILLSVAAVAVADVPDVSVLTWDELNELQSKITLEMATRPEWKSGVLPLGIFEVGVDIPAGRYVVTTAKTGKVWGTFIWDDADGDFNRGPYQYAQLSQSGYVDTATSVVVTLEAGTFVKVEKAEMLLTVYTGLQW